MACPKIIIPGTALEVSRVCLGCWQLNDGKANASWEAQSKETSQAIVDKCFEVGINFFDTAEGYAGSEEILGECLKNRERSSYVVASKFGFREGPGTPPYSPVQIEEAITKSLNKLKIGYIDIMQVHFPSFLPEDQTEAINQLNKEIQNKRIRYWGLSNYGPKNLQNLQEKLAKFGPNVSKPVCNQMGYNLLWRSMEYEVLPACKAMGLGIFAYSPLQQGLLSGRFKSADDVPLGRKRGKLFSMESCNIARHGQPGAEKEVFEALEKIREICDKNNIQMAPAALSWILKQDGITCAIVGARTPEQVVENSKIIELSDSIVKELSAATEPVKNKIGKVLDQWAHPDRCE